MSDNILLYEGELYRASLNRAAFDFITPRLIIIPPHTTITLNSEVRFPNGIGNLFGIITIRSSYQKKKINIPPSGIGILDSNYTDYIFLNIENASNKTFIIQKGERIAQLVFVEMPDIILTKND